MYMIAGLCMLKLYQKRHPDINASAYSAYACLAIVIFFSVVGVVSASPGAASRGRSHWLRGRQLAGIPCADGLSPGGRVTGHLQRD